MEFIDSSVEVWVQDHGIEGIYEMIERCARICYRSENKGNITSEQFVKKLIKMEHLRCCEFGTVAIDPDNLSLFDHVKWRLRSIFNPWVIRNDAGIYITNLRYLIEHYKDNWEEYLNKNFYSDIFPFDYRPVIVWHVGRVTADSFRTHVMLSTLGESTRYCNYTKKGGVVFVKPQWFEKTSFENLTKAKEVYEGILEKISNAYNELIGLGLKPEEARGVLGLDVATTFVQCGFVSAWKNFFKQRLSKAAHPDAQYVAKKAYSYFEKHWK